MGTRLRSGFNRLRRDLAAGGIFLIYWILRSLPRRMAIWLCRLLGRAAWIFDASGRRVALQNLERAYGERHGLSRRRAMGRAAYVNLAANLADLSRLSRMSGNELAALVTEGEETLVNLEDAIGDRRGVILLTPHLGNWELLAAYLANRGVSVHFVGREPYDGRLDPLFEAVRTSQGASWVRRGGAFEQLCQILGRGEVAILLIDHDTGRAKGTFVEFFGKRAWTPTGPAALGRLTESVMVPSALLRRADNTYRLLIEAPIQTVSTGDAEYDDWENTRRASLAVESLIERSPEHWTWFHRRWRTHPPADWVPPAPPRPLANIEVPPPGEGEIP